LTNLRATDKNHYFKRQYNTLLFNALGVA